MNPYRDAAVDYFDTGVGSPIPSWRPLSKRPPLAGWTGRNGAVASREQVERWRVTHPASNVLLRLNRGVVGIDVDGYGDKRGGDTFIAVAGVHCALPPSWRSSARRNDAVSGIRFYRLHDGMDEAESKGDFGARSDIEVVRRSHRYAVVAPSWHEGVEARYRWYGPDGVVTDTSPQLGGLPYLPWGWWKHLTQRCGCFARQRREVTEQSKRYRKRQCGVNGRRGAVTDFLAGIDALSVMPEGSRNNYLSRLAGRTFLFDVLGSMALTYDEVTAMLREAGVDAGLDDEEVERTLHSAAEWAAGVAS